MSVRFEHQSIRAALLSAEIHAPAAPENGCVDEASSAVFVAWSSRDALLFCPEYAWLSVPEVVYLQLPLSRAVLETTLKRGAQSCFPVDKIRVLSMPLGQWAWAVKSLQGALSSGQREESVLRLAQLRRFALQHWPGWYESVLAALREKIDKGVAVLPSEIEKLTRHAGAVVTLGVCRSLLSWTQERDKAETLTLLQDALSYARQGLYDEDDLRPLVVNHAGWTELQSDLDVAEAQLREVESCLDAPENIVERSLRLLNKGRARVRHLNEIIEGSLANKIQQAHRDINFVMLSLRALAKLREEVYAALHD
ncbi:MAG TPA: hypothetical protein VGC89_07420 [Pyrinomonadaceae bacterium]|jgi:hypothetical protein